MSQIPYETLASPQFEQMLKINQECFKSAFVLGTKMFTTTDQPQRPAAKQQPQPAADKKLDQLIQAALQSSQTNGVQVKSAQKPMDLFRKPSSVGYKNVAQLTKTQAEHWAAGTIRAHLIGFRAFKRSLPMVQHGDQLPLTELHLLRTQRVIRLARKWEKIPPIDAVNGKVKQKQASVLQRANQQLPREKELQFLTDYRRILKDTLRDFNSQFEKVFGKEPSKDDKEVLRILYTDYKTLKQFVGEEPEQKIEKVEDPNLRQLSQILADMRVDAQKMLKKTVPHDQPSIKLFKKEVQKCLFAYKEAYDKCQAEVNTFKKQNGKMPVGFTDAWSAPFIEIYNLLFSAYEKLKAQIK